MNLSKNHRSYSSCNSYRSTQYRQDRMAYTYTSRDPNSSRLNNRRMERHSLTLPRSRYR